MVTTEALSNKLARYKSKTPIEYRPLQLDFYKPERIDRDDNYESFRRNMESINSLSQAGTEIYRTKALNTAIKIREQEMARLRKLASQPIDLSGVTPKYSGMLSPNQLNAYNRNAPNDTNSRGFIQPLRSYRTTSGYGRRIDPHTRAYTKMHTGIDLAAPSGTPIYATHGGVVASAGWGGGYGNLVILQGGNGLQTYYAHQSRIAVKPGQRVRRGQVIGFVGSTGKSTGPHLHYEVRIGGRHINPAGYL